MPTIDASSLSGWADVSPGEHTLGVKAKADGYTDSEAATAAITKPAAGYTVAVYVEKDSQNPSFVYQNSVDNLSGAELLGEIETNETAYLTVTKEYLIIDWQSNFAPAPTGGVTYIKTLNQYGHPTYAVYRVTGDGTAPGFQLCLTGDTIVTMSDLTEKRLDEIEVGDKILSYDWTTMMLVPNEVIYTDKNENRSHVQYDKWTFSDGTVVKTVHPHEFYCCETRGMKYMSEWKIGEHAYKRDGTTPALISHETVDETVRHYKISGKIGTNYFANGLLTGDRNCAKNIILG